MASLKSQGVGRLLPASSLRVTDTRLLSALLTVVFSFDKDKDHDAADRPKKSVSTLSKKTESKLNMFWDECGVCIFDVNASESKTRDRFLRLLSKCSDTTSSSEGVQLWTNESVLSGAVTNVDSLKLPLEVMRRLLPFVRVLCGQHDSCADSLARSFDILKNLRTVYNFFLQSFC